MSKLPRDPVICNHGMLSVARIAKTCELTERANLLTLRRTTGNNQMKTASSINVCTARARNLLVLDLRLCGGILLGRRPPLYCIVL